MGDHSLVSGDAKGAEERHVGLVERLAAEELPAPPLVAPAACSGHHRGVGAQARPSIADLAPISDLQRGVPADSDDRAAALPEAGLSTLACRPQSLPELVIRCTRYA